MGSAPTFSLETLRQRVGALPTRSRIAFALAYAERMFPAYVLFAERTGRQAYTQVLRRALRAGWACCSDGAASDEIDALRQEAKSMLVEDNISSDDFPAQNARAAVVLALVSCFDPNPDAVIHVASRSIETAEGLVIGQRGISGVFKSGALDAVIRSDPLIEAEMQWLEQTLSSLESHPVNDDFLAELRKNARESSPYESGSAPIDARS